MLVWGGVEWGGVGGQVASACMVRPAPDRRGKTKAERINHPQTHLCSQLGNAGERLCGPAGPRQQFFVDQPEGARQLHLQGV